MINELLCNFNKPKESNQQMSEKVNSLRKEAATSQEKNSLTGGKKLKRVPEYNSEGKEMESSSSLMMQLVTQYRPLIVTDP